MSHAILIFLGRSKNIFSKFTLFIHCKAHPTEMPLLFQTSLSSRSSGGILTPRLYCLPRIFCLTRTLVFLPGQMILLVTSWSTPLKMTLRWEIKHFVFGSGMSWRLEDNLWDFRFINQYFCYFLFFSSAKKHDPSLSRVVVTDRCFLFLYD